MVLVMSYNVAGWITTLTIILQQYGSLGAWLDRHGIDILCLQETKVTTTKVEDEPNSCAARESGWASTWSCYRPAQGDARRRTGTWNGVATFCRTGLLASADADPLGSAELDGEGRCLMTDHGEFVLFNVYVPTSTDLPFKCRFLRALRAAMARQRALGRAVILAGDLNLSRRAQDVPTLSRLVSLNSMLGDKQVPQLPLTPPLAAKLARLAPQLRVVLSQLVMVHLPGGDAGGTGRREAFARRNDAYQARWTSPTGESVRLGKPYGDELSAQRQWAQLETDVMMSDPEDAEAPPLLVRRAGMISVANLAELVVKALMEPLSAEEQRELAQHGTSTTVPFLVDWAEALIGQDGMVDSFAALRGDYEERFTCWEQYTNQRYSNFGSRIDYIFVDAPLFNSRALAGAELSDGSSPAATPELEAARRRPPVQSAEAALSACTAGGRWQAAPFDGSGMLDPPLSVYDTQFAAPGTGVRIMPPRYSDHTAVTLLLAPVTPPPPPLKLLLDAATRKASPHLSTPSIKSFFAPKPPKPAGAAAEEAARDEPPASAGPAEPEPAATASTGGQGSGSSNPSAKKRKAPPPLPPGQRGLSGMWSAPPAKPQA